MNMMFPKPTKQKKRKKHKKSIMQPKGDRWCYLCMLLDGDFACKPYLEEHHVLFGNTHAFAEAEGLKVNLCLEHHRNGPAMVYSQTWTNANGSGELYLTKLDKKILGVGNRIGYTNPYSGLIQTEEEA